MLITIRPRITGMKKTAAQVNIFLTFYAWQWAHFHRVKFWNLGGASKATQTVIWFWPKLILTTLKPFWPFRFCVTSKNPSLAQSETQACLKKWTFGVRTIHSRYNAKNQISSRNWWNPILDLGVQAEKVFSPSAQCAEAANKARRLIFMMRRSFQDLSKLAVILWFEALVRPHLGYGMHVRQTPWQISIINSEFKDWLQCW